MAIDPSAVWDFAKEVIGAARPDRGRTLATVTRIDADGTVWVTTGDSGEAPASSVAAGVSVGDTVTLEWDGASMGIRGNVSNPSPAGSVVRRAVERTRSVADAAQKVADAVNQHFFADTHGIHVTEATQEDWEESHEGANVLINALGQLFRDGLNNLLTLTTQDGARALTIWDGLGNTAAHVLATFSANGISFADGTSFDIGDSSAYINFDGNGHISIGGSGLTIGGYATDDDVADAISNISIGGRNLLQDSKFTTAFNAGLWTLDGLSATLSDNKLVIDGSVAATGNKRVYQSTVRFSHVSGTTYTFSCDIVATAACQVSFGRRYGTTNNYGVTFNATTTSQRISGTYTATSIGAFCISEVSNSATVTISNPKLEIGNIATDWTPAPEDMASSADSVEFISGTQTAATNAWTGVTKDASLSTGKMIAYYLPYAGTSSAATLNLTLSGGGTTGAKSVKYNNNNSAANNVTTHYGAGSIIYMTYDGTYWRVAASYYDTSGIANARYRTQNPNAIKAAEAITASHIICGTSSGYKNIAASVTFDLSYPLLFAGSAIESGSTGTNNYLTYNGVSVTNNGSITGATSNAMVFLKGTVSGNTFAIAASGFITCTVPNSDDGYAYIPLGILYNGTNGIYFSASKDLYAYKDGAFGPVSIREASAAAKTATSYVTDIDSNGITVHPSRSDYATNGGRAVINGDGLTVYLGSDDVASYGASARIGKANSDRVTVDSTNGITIYKGNSKKLQTTANGIDVYGSDGTTSVASFGSTARLGSTSSGNYLVMNANGLNLYNELDGTNYSSRIGPSSVSLLGGNFYIQSLIDGGTASTFFDTVLSQIYSSSVQTSLTLRVTKDKNTSTTSRSIITNSPLSVTGRIDATSQITGTYQLVATGEMNEIALRANTSGNRGLYDVTNDEWILYRDGNNDNLVIKFLSSNFDIDAAVVLSGSTSISANGVQTGTTNITKSGWVPVAIAGVNVNSHWAATVRWYLSARGSGTGTIGWAVHNMSGTAAITPTVTFYVLWVRGD